MTAGALSKLVGNGVGCIEVDAVYKGQMYSTGHVALQSDGSGYVSAVPEAGSYKLP